MHYLLCSCFPVLNDYSIRDCEFIMLQVAKSWFLAFSPLLLSFSFFFFFFNDPAPPEISPLPLPDALPISWALALYRAPARRQHHRPLGPLAGVLSADPESRETGQQGGQEATYVGGHRTNHRPVGMARAAELVGFREGRVDVVGVAALEQVERALAVAEAGGPNAQPRAPPRMSAVLLHPVQG